MPTKLKIFTYWDNSEKAHGKLLMMITAMPGLLEADQVLAKTGYNPLKPTISVTISEMEKD